MSTDTEFMGRWFTEATKPQLATYNQRMSDAAPYRNSPKWERMRDHAQRHFRYETTEARQLYERGMADLEAFGELSEETDELLAAFDRRPVITQQAAE